MSARALGGLPPHPPAALLRRRPAGRTLALCLFYGLALLAGLAMVLAESPLPAGVQVIEEAVFTPAPRARARTPGTPAADTPLALPHRCESEAGTGAGDCSGSYRAVFRYESGADAADSWSVYVPTFAGHIVLRVNGVLLTDSRRFQTSTLVNRAGPLIQVLPAPLLHVGDNLIDIRVEGWNRYGVFLDRLAVGPDSLLRPAYIGRERVLGTLPRLLVAWQAALCLSLLIVWIGCRRERIHLMMSGILGLGVLQGVPLFLADADGADWLVRVTNLTGLWQGALLPVMIAHLVGRRLAVPAGWLAVPPALVTLALLLTLADPAVLVPWFALLWVAVVVPWVLAVLGWSAWITLRAALGENHGPAQFVLGGLIVAAILALHDVLAVTGLLADRLPLLGRFIAPLLSTVVSATLMWRFAQALTSVSRFNEVLCREVETAEAALRASFAREQAQTRAAALESERLRLTRDLHDGLAGQLVSILAQCELPQRDYRRIGESARRALDDLRLVIASLEDVGNDLGMMLAQFHERIEPQLQAQGVELDWRMAPLPEIEGLRSEHALTLFRILQEAVTNAVRHSGSRHVTISMSPAPAAPEAGPDRAVRIIVSDCGRGMAAAPPSTGGGRGLNNMRQRAATLGADLLIDSGADGTRVVVDLPRTLSAPGEKDSI